MVKDKEAHSSLLFNTVLNVPAIATGKKKKGRQIQKEKLKHTVFAYHMTVKKILADLHKQLLALNTEFNKVIYKNQLYIYTGSAKKMHTDFKRRYLCITLQS